MQAIATAILKTQVGMILEHIKDGALPGLVTGLSAVHRASLAAALRIETGRPVVVICPDENSMDSLNGDITALMGGEAPVTLTSRDLVLYSAEGVSRGAEQNRLSALSRMARGEAQVALMTVAGMLQRTMPPEVLERAGFAITVGETVSVDSVEERLVRCGYIRTSQVEGAGQFSRRGGILDMYSPAYALPVRCEFWGDEIDSCGFFEVDSQRRVENLERCEILPCNETLPAMAEGGIPALCAEIEALAAREGRRRNKNERLIESLREDGERLSGGGHLAASDRYMALVWKQLASGIDYIPGDAIVLISEPQKCLERAKDAASNSAEDIKSLLLTGALHGSLAEFAESWESALIRLRNLDVVMADMFTMGRYPMEPGSILGLTAKQLPSYGGSAEAAAEDLKHYLERDFGVVILAGDERRARYMLDFFTERDITCGLEFELSELPKEGRAVVTVGGLSSGIEYPDARLAVLTESQISGTGFRKRTTRKKAVSNRQRIGSYADLSVGDLVVHEHHGIGRFAGIFKMPVEGVEKDYVKISYAGTDNLYVPATSLDLVSKYIGGGESAPARLSKMGGSDWTRAKSRAKHAAKELASELIRLYAERQRMPGYAFSRDMPWQTEFENSFGYTETDDQLRSVSEIKEDMEKHAPMDRLLCGDVGYGKTEVALRAVMKCVLDGKQAAILVPTTVLAQQHFQTAVQRFFGYPVRIEVLSRFRTPAQVKTALRDLKSGSVDIIIGTHRLLQKDIGFHDLGLLIIDEEQRFGVSHKERLKEIGRGVDVLTLSATPIPRTLNMALTGIRDMSTIEEPPQDRLPVQTYVMEHDWGVLCDAIRREVARGGQVYYLHNRVENIERTAIRISEMLDGEVNIAVAHGRMDEQGLSSVMESMTNGEVQVLVCTTIIETGIDIPNVNTLIIEDADKLGLAQLHQIRGRVGRSSRRASAYLTFRKDKVLTEIAEKRLSAVREFAEFNSGFKIAMRDLEIRGAGNLLGAEQSGHLINVGYDMYLKLLEEAVLEQQGKAPEVRAECSADLAVSANIPDRYVPSAEQRMDLYRRIAMIRTEEEADDLTDELIDRFGDPPPSVNTLVHVALLRGEASVAKVVDIQQKAGYLRFTLLDFNFELVSRLYEQEDFKGRLKVEAAQKPTLSLRLKSSKQVIEQARRFVAVYAALSGEEVETVKDQA